MIAQLDIALPLASGRYFRPNHTPLQDALPIDAQMPRGTAMLRGLMRALGARMPLPLGAEVPLGTPTGLGAETTTCLRGRLPLQAMEHLEVMLLGMVMCFER